MRMKARTLMLIGVALLLCVSMVSGKEIWTPAEGGSPKLVNVAATYYGARAEASSYGT